jgi:hypothetical protein
VSALESDIVSLFPAAFIFLYSFDRNVLLWMLPTTDLTMNPAIVSFAERMKLCVSYGNYKYKN